LFTANENEVHSVDFPPFVSSEVVDGGMVSEIVRTALSRANIHADITIHPLRSMVLYYLTQENAMAMLGRHTHDLSQNPDKLITIPVITLDENYFYYQPKHPQGLKWEKDMKQLKGLTYGAHEGEDTSRFEKVGVHIVKGRTMSLIKKMVRGEVDFILAPSPTMEWLLKRYLSSEANKFTTVKDKMHKEAMVIAFNPNHKEATKAAQQFKAALAAMKKDGTFAAIVNRHLGGSEHGKLYLRRLDTL